MHQFLAHVYYIRVYHPHNPYECTTPITHPALSMLSLITTPILLLQMIKSSEAFTTKPTFVRSLSTIHRAGSDNDVQYGGNTWSPEAGKMQSTDVGDYFPEDFDQGEAQDMFDSGTKNMGGTKQADTERPGLEDLGQGGFVAGEGYKTPEGIPDGMEFLPTSNPDGKFQFNVASSGKGERAGCRNNGYIHY